MATNLKQGIPYGLRDINITAFLQPKKQIKIIRTLSGKVFGELHDDNGAYFGSTKNYATPYTFRRGMDRFFGKGNWEEVK